MSDKRVLSAAGKTCTAKGAVLLYKFMSWKDPPSTLSWGYRTVGGLRLWQIGEGWGRHSVE